MQEIFIRCIAVTTYLSYANPPQLSRRAFDDYTIGLLRMAIVDLMRTVPVLWLVIHVKVMYIM